MTVERLVSFLRRSFTTNAGLLLIGGGLGLLSFDAVEYVVIAALRMAGYAPVDLLPIWPAAALCILLGLLVGLGGEVQRRRDEQARVDAAARAARVDRWRRQHTLLARFTQKFVECDTALSETGGSFGKYDPDLVLLLRAADRAHLSGLLGPEVPERIRTALAAVDERTPNRMTREDAALIEFIAQERDRVRGLLDAALCSEA